LLSEVKALWVLADKSLGNSNLPLEKHVVLLLDLLLVVWDAILSLESLQGLFRKLLSLLVAVFT
jgi:hypothetical protein